MVDWSGRKVALIKTLCTLVPMKPMLKIIRGLRGEPDGVGQVFALSDVRALLPEHRDGAFKSVVTRLEKRGDLGLPGHLYLAGFNVARKRPAGMRGGSSACESV